MTPSHGIVLGTGVLFALVFFIAARQARRPWRQALVFGLSAGLIFGVFLWNIEPIVAMFRDLEVDPLYRQHGVPTLGVEWRK